VGASFSLTSLNFASDREFTESGKTRTYPGQDPTFINAGYSLDYHSFQETTGSGYNAKIGVIYRASPYFRFGASFISPTWYTLSDEFSEGLDTRYTPASGNFIDPYINDEELYPTDYTLRTPYRANLGAAVILSKIGLISADVEYVDYTTTKFSSGDQKIDVDMRRDIRDNFDSALNLRLGLEGKVSSAVLLRAGYSMQGNPYKTGDYSANTFSAGLGYRVKNISFDLAFTSLSSEFTRNPYSISASYPDYEFTGGGPTATLKNTNNNVFATIGLRF
jgi:opacity protein-like surface antigen